MNPTTIERIYQGSETTGRHRFGGRKPINGDKRRRTEEYGLKSSNHERRKQGKVRYDTWRRQEMPNEEDIKLSNIHYANFLGDKYGDHGAPYDASVVNVSYCDCMRECDDPDWLEYKANLDLFEKEMADIPMTNEQARAYRDEHWPELAEDRDSDNDDSLAEAAQDEIHERVWDEYLADLYPEQDDVGESRWHSLFIENYLVDANKRKYNIVLKELEDSVYEEEEPHQPEDVMDDTFEEFAEKYCGFWDNERLHNPEGFGAYWDQEGVADYLEAEEYRMSLLPGGKRAHFVEAMDNLFPSKKARCDDESFNV